MFNLFANLVSPSKGIELLKKGIEHELNRKIETFTIIYVASQDDLFFKIPIDGKEHLKKYSANNKDMLMFAVKQMSKAKLQKDETLDLCSCTYNKDGSLNLQICLTRNGVKIKEEINNYKP